jgi:hypothetical protein
VEDGYEFYARRQLVTIFSAPNYCGEFDNAGAMMSVDDTLMCSFQVNIAAHEGSLILLSMCYDGSFLRLAVGGGGGVTRTLGDLSLHNPSSPLADCPDIAYQPDEFPPMSNCF